MNPTFRRRGPIRLRAASRTLHAALIGLLDVIDLPLLVCRSDGTEPYHNRALVRLLENESPAEDLIAEMGRLAEELYAEMNSAPLSTNVQRRDVKTPTAWYSLRASMAPPDLFPPHGAVLVAAERLRPELSALPGPETLRARYDLTRREAEVALLLAEGLSNDQIAERLFVSPHTTRRHTENVLGKLGLCSRKALALKLFQDDTR